MTSNPEVQQWRDLVESVKRSLKYPYSTSLILGQIDLESAGNPDALSTDGQGSVGLLQITPRYSFQRFGFTSQDDYATSLRNPFFNVYTSFLLMNDILAQNGGDYMASLEIYNKGHAVQERDYALAVCMRAANY